MGVQFSTKASDKIASLIQEEGNPDLNFRVYITGGGCSGFQYGITFDENINEDDTIIEQTCSNDEKVKVIIDSISYPYLKNINVDFTDSPEQFKIQNTDVKTTCGCGSSFSIED